MNTVAEKIMKRIQEKANDIKSDFYNKFNVLFKVEKDIQNIEVIAQNSERYMMIKWGKMRFIDSQQFMNTSLDNLAKNLTNDKKINTINFMKNELKFSDEQISLLLQKGEFPYEYFDSLDRLKETKLPKISDFYSNLSGKTITEEQYNHSIKVWNNLHCKTFKDYLKYYLLVDVLLLADIFEEFRNVSMNYYGIDPTHVFTSPGMSFHAMLRMTEINLELLSDLDMYMFYNHGIKGGISMIRNRYAIANNPYLKDYDPSKPTTYIIYLDANNLYGWAMSQCLPHSGFKWEEDVSRFTKDYILNLKDDADVGYHLEVDLELPEHLHDLFNDYCPAPVHKDPTEYNTSNYLKTRLNQLQQKQSKTKKLLCTLDTKTNYAVHYRNLKYYLELGCVLLKVHRVISFNQSTWLKKYIDLNTELRQKAKNDFEKDFFKLMNNSVFGKMMEDVLKRCNYQLLTQSQSHKIPRMFNIQNRTTIGENLILLHKTPQEVILDKPIYVGFSILELSKLHMYKFHYGFMMKKYGPEKCKLNMTDTDSFCYWVETQDIYKDFSHHLELFDISETENVNNPLYKIKQDILNNNALSKAEKINLLGQKVIGRFKCETKGYPIEGFIGLRSKMYYCYYNTDDGIHDKFATKGIPKKVSKKLKWNFWKERLFDETEIPHMIEFYGIKSKGHKVTTDKCCKKGLSNTDDKGYTLDDGITTLAYGHYKLKKEIQNDKSEKSEKSEKSIYDYIQDAIINYFKIISSSNH